MLGNLGRVSLGTLAMLSLLGPGAEAGGGRFLRRSASPAPVVTSRVVPAPRATGTLGTFSPTPYIIVRGSIPAGGGYSPLGNYGLDNLVLYGPTSTFRNTSAPVLTYTRGYDGRTVVAPGTSFSSPNQPFLSPVVYPTQGSNYYGFKQSGSPPWWANGDNFLDQN